MNVISACSVVLTLRAQFAQFLFSNTAITANRYFRLMALALISTSGL
jgi:hypothetical protein